MSLQFKGQPAVVYFGRSYNTKLSTWKGAQPPCRAHLWTIINTHSISFQPFLRQQSANVWNVQLPNYQWCVLGRPNGMRMVDDLHHMERLRYPGGWIFGTQI
jgi:hypothetical protein